MKEITAALKHKISMSHAGISPMKWSEVYDTEEELVRDMFSDKVKVEGARDLCKGYEYIKGFRSFHTKNRTLTEKQMTQLKRLAAEIAYCVYVK